MQLVYCPSHGRCEGAWSLAEGGPAFLSAGEAEGGCMCAVGTRVGTALGAACAC